VALDDFGTGYSSLSHLRTFPIDVVKVDRSFTAGLDRPSGGLGAASADYSMVAAILSLGKSLGITTVAEGVETAEQEAVLRELGCDFAQGYLFSRPLPADQLPTFRYHDPRVQASV
jgi:EAL domain-containing protein (putative c-di-GMP-specific phosphodiesterase class I)